MLKIKILTKYFLNKKKRILCKQIIIIFDLFFYIKIFAKIIINNNFLFNKIIYVKSQHLLFITIIDYCDCDVNKHTHDNNNSRVLVSFFFCWFIIFHTKSLVFQYFKEINIYSKKKK